MFQIEAAHQKPPTDMASSSLDPGLNTAPFSIRGYVAAVRDVNIRKCWPFSLRLLEKCLDEGKDPLLPPLGGSYSLSSRDYHDLEGSFSTIRSAPPTSSTAVGTGLLGQQIELHLDLKGKISGHASEGEQVLSRCSNATDADAVEDEAEDETGNIYQGLDTGLVVKTLGVPPGLHVNDDAKNLGAIAIEQKSNGMIEHVTSEKEESANGSEDSILNKEKKTGNTPNAEDETDFYKSVGHDKLLSSEVDLQGKDGNEEEIIMCDPPHEKEEGSAGDGDLAKEKLSNQSIAPAEMTQEVRTPQSVVRNDKIVGHLLLSFSSSPEEEEEESSEQEIYEIGKRFSELGDVMAITDAQKCPICLKFQSCSNIALNAHIDHCLAIAEKTVVVKEKRAKSKARKKRSMAELCLVAPQCSVEGSKRRRESSCKNRSLNNNILRKKRGDIFLRGGERIAESLTGKKRKLVKELQSSALRIKNRHPPACNRSSNGSPSDATKKRNEEGGGCKSNGQVSNYSPTMVKGIGAGSSGRAKKNIYFRKTELSSSDKRHKLPSRSRKYPLQNFSVKAYHSKKTEGCSGVVTKGRSSMKRGRAMNLLAAQNPGKPSLALDAATVELEVHGIVSAKVATMRLEDTPIVSHAGTAHDVYRPTMSVSNPSCDDDDDDDDAYDNAGQLALPGPVGIGKEVQTQGKDGRGILPQGCFWKESQGQTGSLPEAPCLNCNMAESEQCTCHGKRSGNGPGMATEAEQEGQCQQSPNQSILSSRVLEKHQSRAVPLQQVLHSDVSLLMYSGSNARSQCPPGENVSGTSNREEPWKKKEKTAMKELIDINATFMPESCMDAGFHQAAVVAPLRHHRRRQDQLLNCEVLGRKQRRKNLARKMVNFFDELHSQRIESSVMGEMPVMNLPPTQDTQREPAVGFSFPPRNHAFFLTNTDVQQPAIYRGYNLTSKFPMQNLAENSVNASSSSIGNATSQKPPHKESPTNQSTKPTDHRIPSTEHAMLSKLGNPGLRLMGKTILNPESGPTEPEMAFEKLGSHRQHGKNLNYMLSGTSQEGLVRKGILEDGLKSNMINRSTQVHNDIGSCQYNGSSYNFNGSTISYGRQDISQPTQPAQSDSLWTNRACYEQAFPLHLPVIHNLNSLSWKGESRVLPKAPSVQAPLTAGDFLPPSKTPVLLDRSSIPASYQHIRPIQSASSVEALTKAGYNVFSSCSQPPFRGPPSVTYNLPIAGTSQNSPSLYLDERSQGGCRLTALPQHFIAGCPYHDCNEANASVVLHPKSPTFQPPYPLASSSAKGKHVYQETPSWIMQSKTKRQSEDNIVIIEDEPPQPKLASSSFFANSVNINKWKNQTRTGMARSVFPVGMETSRLNVSSLPPANHSRKGGTFSEKVAMPESCGPNQANMQHMNTTVLGFHSRQNIALGDVQKSTGSGAGNVRPIMDEALVQIGSSDWVRRDLASRIQHESSTVLFNSITKEHHLPSSLFQWCSTLSEILPGFSYVESITPFLSPEAGPIGMCTTNMNPAEINIDFQDGTCFVKLPSSNNTNPGSSSPPKASSENRTLKSPSLTHLSRRASENKQILNPLQKERREDTQPFLQQWNRASQLPTIFDSSDRRLIWSDFGKSSTERCLVQSNGSSVEEESSRSGALLQCGCETYTFLDKERRSLKPVKLTNPCTKSHIVNGRALHSFVDVPLQRELYPLLIAGNDQNYFSEPSPGVLFDNICGSQKSHNQTVCSLPLRSSKESSAELMKQVNLNPCDSITCGGNVGSKEAAASFSLTKR